jgi:transcriptional regulator with XRE-family HTH domain
MYSKNAEFAERMKKLRKDRGLTQEELAKEINVRKTTICNYEKGYSTPTYEIRQKLSKFFNIESTYFIPDLSKRAAQRMAGTSIPFFLPDNINGLRLKENNLADSSLTLPVMFKLPREGCIATAAPDNSMNLCGIKKNHCVIINPNKLLHDGCVFAAIWNESLIIRKYHQNEEHTYMYAESNKIPSGESIQMIPTESFSVLGVVTKCIVNF